VSAGSWYASDLPEAVPVARTTWCPWKASSAASTWCRHGQPTPEDVYARTTSACAHDGHGTVTASRAGSSAR